ncbi:MAG: hemolysin family protein [Alphaproteobacteria bacterium]
MIYAEIGVLLLLTGLNGVLAMSELAVVSSRRGRLEQLAAAGNRGARTALGLIDDPSRFLSTVQIGITLIGILAGAVSGATLGERLGDWLDTHRAIHPNGDAIAIPLVVVAVTYLSLVIGELVPKRIAMNDPERLAARVAGPMRLLSRLAAPMVALLSFSTDVVLRLLGQKRAKASTVTEEEVKSLIAEGTQAGVFAPEERAMIEGVLRLADRSVRAIMTPRQDVVWVDLKAPEAATVEILKTTEFSRLLVCEGAVDHAVGVVHTKHLLARTLRGQPLGLAEAMQPAIAVPESAPVLALLERFRGQGTHMAVVVDEYGLTEGIATPTDILEAIAGALPELGEEEGDRLVRRADGSWLVDGLLPIDELAHATGLPDLEGEGYHTVGGFVLHRLGRLPKVGDRVEHADAVLEVVDMDGRRIDKVLVQRRPED